MLVHQIYAIIKKETIDNIIVCENYTIANDLAKMIDKESIAVDVTYYPVRIGDKYVEGLFRDKNNNEIINAMPTEKESINILKKDSATKDTKILDLEMGAEATQEALDMLLLASMGESVSTATLAANTFSIERNINKEVVSMAAYIAMRILKKGEISVEAGRDYYVTWITHPAYAKFKTDVDLILMAEERDDLIVESL